jgi:hypothetical protein
MVGESVMLLVHTDDRPQWATARIALRKPLTVEFDVAYADVFSGISNLTIIHDSGRKYTKGEGKVGPVQVRGNSAVLAFEDFRWEAVDNRDNPRFETKVQVVIRAIQDIEDRIEVDDQVGMSMDFSLGGALIKLRNPIHKGQLVELRATLDSVQTIRAMGVVAHTDEPGTLVGISFIDYIGSARYSLHQYLSRLAA